jgi:hypothetical protein
MNADELMRTAYRIPLEEAIRLHKRSPTFRSASFATAELLDPLEPTQPFRRCDLLPIIEEEWCFRRDAVPEWITLKTGRAAREQLIEGLKEEYGLDPAMRFKRLEGSARAYFYDVHDPDTWRHDPFLCLITVAPEHGGLEVEFNWFGSRARALTDPALRPWFFDSRSRVLHGSDAVRLATDAWKKRQTNP